MNRILKTKKGITFIIVIIALIVLGIFLVIAAQNYGLRRDFESESVDFVGNVTESVKRREADLKKLDEYNRILSADLIYNISYIYDGTDFPHLNWNQRRKLAPANLMDMDKFDLDCLYICGEDGTIWICDDERMIGRSIVDEGILTADQMASFSEGEGHGTYKTGYDENGDPRIYVEPAVSFANGHRQNFYAVEVYGKNEDEKYYAIGANRNDFENAFKNSFTDLGVFFDSIVDYDGFSAFAVNTDTGIIEYTSRSISDLKGRLASDVGIGDVKSLDDGQFHTVSIGGRRHRIFTRNVETELIGNYAVAAVDIKADGSLIHASVACIIVLIVVVYLLLRAGYKLATERRKHLLKEFTACALVCVVLAGGAGTYLSTISAISQAMTQCEVNSETFSKYYMEGRRNAADMSEFYRTKKVSVLRSIASYLEQRGDALMDPSGGTVYDYYNRKEDGTREYVKDSLGNVTASMAGSEGLKTIAEDEGYEDLYVINRAGNTIVTSSDNWYYSINSGESGYDEQLTDVLDRKTSGFYDYADGKDGGTEIVAVPYNIYMSSDGDGVTRFHSAAEYSSDKSGSIKKEYGLLVAVSGITDSTVLGMESIPGEILDSMKTAEKAELAITEEAAGGSHPFILYTSGLNPEDSENMEIPDSYYLADNYKFVRLGGVRKMIGISCLKDLENMNIITVLDNRDIQSQRWPVVAATMLAVIIISAVMTAHFMRNSYELPEKPRTREDEDEDGDDDDDSEEEEYQGSMDHGTLILSTIALIVFAVAMILAVSSGHMKMLSYAITVRWEKGLHIFSVSYVIYLIFAVMVVITVARRFVRLLAPVLSGGGETMLRLLLSLVQYGSIIAWFLYTLYLFGVQMGTVFTSASILTVVIGLGANSLIGDIFAGLFIIFEREYKVGDIITLKDFTGVVRSIGLRTTTVENTDGNIRTFNNSTISGVINLTDNATRSYFDLCISNDIPVKKIEKLVKTRLRQRALRSRDILSDPLLIKLDGRPLESNGYYSIRITAACEQKNVDSVRKLLFGEFIEILRSEGIPFL